MKRPDGLVGKMSFGQALLYKNPVLGRLLNVDKDAYKRKTGVELPYKKGGKIDGCAVRGKTKGRLR